MAEVPASLPLPPFLREPVRETSGVACQINFAKREITFKIVLVGPGDTKHCSKGRALELLHAELPAADKGELTSNAVEGDRTLFFETRWPAKVGLFSVKIVPYTVPGACYYSATRKLVSTGASGFVFVPSTSLFWLDDGVFRLAEVEEHLRDLGSDVATVPSVFLWMRGSMAHDNVEPEQLAPLFNPRRVRPEFFADYVKGGEGIRKAFEAVIAQLVERAAKQYGPPGQRA